MFSSPYNTRNRSHSRTFKSRKKLYPNSDTSQSLSNVLEPIAVNEDANSFVPYVSEEKENIEIIDINSSEEHLKPCLKEYNSPVETRDAIDKAFDQFDELYIKAALPTPRQKVTTFKFLLSPDKLCNPPLTMNPFDQTPLRVRKNGTLFSPVQNSCSTKRKKVTFNCSTPKPYSNIDDFRTPLNGTNLMETPVSGIKPLTFVDKSLYEINTPVSEAKQLTSGNYSLFTENNYDDLLSSFQSGYCASPFNNTSSSAIYLPPEIKEKLLVDVVCYVDCRVDKKEASEVVMSELRSLGAMVEKNFTKKVTHVVFKDGRRWVYIKAKKEGIPIVGVLWIEACKLIRGIADVEKHPPKDMKKFERILPFQTIKKRRIPILNPNSRIRRNLLLLSEIYPSGSESDGGETSPKKAQTEAKKKVPKNLPENDCIKKLFDEYDLLDENLNGDKNSEASSTVRKENRYLANLDKIHKVESSSSDNSNEIRQLAAVRRKSAPGKLLSKKNSKQEDIKEFLMRAQKKASEEASMNEDSVSLEKNLKETSMNKNELSLEKILDKDVVPLSDEKSNVLIANEKESMKKTLVVKRKKLLDPNECFMDTIESNSVVHSGIEVEIPYTLKRPRTKATCRSKTLKLAIAQKLQEGEKLKTEIADNNEESSPSSVFFVDKPENGCKRKQKQPSVAFTSVPKDQLPKYIEMVKKLGKLTIEDKVTRCTSHVISNGPRRTLNLIKGIARGCWLVDLKWVIESADCGKWLPEENYDLSFHFPAAQDCCKERRSLKSSRVIDIFKDTGCIYVSRKSAPRFNDLEELLRICSANLTSSSEKADIKVGGKSREGSTAKQVSEKWVLDSVTQNRLLPLEDYLENGPPSQAS